MDFLAAFLVIVGSVLFFFGQTQLAGTICFLVGLLFFAATPTIRLRVRGFLPPRAPQEGASRSVTGTVVPGQSGDRSCHLSSTGCRVTLTGMTQPARATARSHRVRVWVGGIAVVALLAGGAVAVVRTPWWGCHVGTSTGDSSLDYELGPETAAEGLGDLVEQVASAPGIGPLLGSAPLEQDVRLEPRADGGLVVSDFPYFAERNEFHDTSLDPVTGETSWSRGQAGQAAVPEVAGDAVLSLAAVEGGIYRLSILDGEDGSVRGCLDVERLDRAGIGRAAAGVSTDGRTVALATPAESGSAVSAYGLEDRDPVWDAALPGTEGTVTWIGDTVVADRFDTRDVYDAGSILWGDDDERARASITGLDAASGAESWTWPADLSDDATPEAGSTVPFVDGPDDVVVVSALTVEDDEHTARLVGLDSATGAELWSAATVTVPWVQGFGDTVVGLAGDVLFAVDASSGEQLWSMPVTGGASGPRPDAAQPFGDEIIVATADGITSIDLATGDLTETSVEDAWALRLTTTSSTLAVVRDDAETRELLVFSRDA